MDLSMLKLDSQQKLVIIEDITPRQTVEAIKELIAQKKIDPYGFQAAHLSYTPVDGPIIEFTRYYSTAPYQYLFIKTINLKNTKPEIGEFTDVECAIKILKMLQLYMFDSIERILKNPEDYVSKKGGKYNILVDKSGLFRFDTPYGGASYIYD